MNASLERRIERLEGPPRNSLEAILDSMTPEELDGIARLLQAELDQDDGEPVEPLTRTGVLSPEDETATVLFIAEYLATVRATETAKCESNSA